VERPVVVLEDVLIKPCALAFSHRADEPLSEALLAGVSGHLTPAEIEANFPCPTFPQPALRRKMIDFLFELFMGYDIVNITGSTNSPIVNDARDDHDNVKSVDTCNTRVLTWLLLTRLQCVGLGWAHHLRGHRRRTSLCGSVPRQQDPVPPAL
jgi:hypothetical protein